MLAKKLSSTFLHTSAKVSNSGRKINYSVRPAKNVERKMMRDFFIRLSHLGRIEDYRYVGFGSKYFSDFIIFHRYLNISEMVSIESDTTNKERYEFNKPYSNITMKWGRSTTVLPELAGSPKRTIYWLDYDGRFEEYMLHDAAIIAESISSGSVIAISFNCESPEFSDGDLASLQDALMKHVSKKYIPSTSDLRGWKSPRTMATFIKNCVKEEISSILENRNLSVESNNQEISFEQKLFFTYADGAPMATVAFLFFSEGEKQAVNDCRLDDLYFIRKSDDPFDITMPNLTIKEIRHLMEIRPDESGINTKIVTLKDAQALWDNYRYFPGFSEIEAF